jgi:hypothetical protein
MRVPTRAARRAVAKDFNAAQRDWSCWLDHAVVLATALSDGNAARAVGRGRSNAYTPTGVTVDLKCLLAFGSTGRCRPAAAVRVTSVNGSNRTVKRSSCDAPTSATLLLQPRRAMSNF